MSPQHLLNLISTLSREQQEAVESGRMSKATIEPWLGPHAERI
jgi:hypothetical protein